MLPPSSMAWPKMRAMRTRALPSWQLPVSIMPQPERVPPEQLSEIHLPRGMNLATPSIFGTEHKLRGRNRPKCRACSTFWDEAVALLDTGWKRLKQMEIDGVRYDICISQRGPLFRAAWVCATCCEQGAWAPVSATADQASELAQIGLRSHHCLVHQASQRLK